MQLKEWLKTKPSISQSEIARRLAMDKSKISRIVNGVELPTLFQAVAIEELTKGKVKPKDWIESCKKQ